MLVYMSSKQRIRREVAQCKPVIIRGISPDTWRRVKAAASLAGATVGQFCEAKLREAVGALRKGGVA